MCHIYGRQTTSTLCCCNLSTRPDTSSTAARTDCTFMRKGTHFFNYPRCSLHTVTLVKNNTNPFFPHTRVRAATRHHPIMAKLGHLQFLAPVFICFAEASLCSGVGYCQNNEAGPVDNETKDVLASIKNHSPPRLPCPNSFRVCAHMSFPRTH